MMVHVSMQRKGIWQNCKEIQVKHTPDSGFCAKIKSLRPQPEWKLLFNKIESNIPRLHPCQVSGCVKYESD